LAAPEDGNVDAPEPAVAEPVWVFIVPEALELAGMLAD
jgi:hypothetical protein